MNTQKTKRTAAQPKRARHQAPIYRGDFEEAVSFVRKKAGFHERISVPRSVLTDWREELESALILLQEIDAALDRGEGLDIPSVLDGAHALVDRVMDGIEDFEERAGERAPQGKS